MVGTSLFWPFTIPASYQPVVTSRTCSPVERSTVGPQAVDASRPIATSDRTSARIARILEHSDEHPLDGLLARDLPRMHRAQIAALDLDHDGALIDVGRRDERPLEAAARANRQPLVGGNRQRAAVAHHRFLDLPLDL